MDFSKQPCVIEAMLCNDTSVCNIEIDVGQMIEDISVLTASTVE